MNTARIPSELCGLHRTGGYATPHRTLAKLTTRLALEVGIDAIDEQDTVKCFVNSFVGLWARLSSVFSDQAGTIRLHQVALLEHTHRAEA
jgi:hypothetical protein